MKSIGWHQYALAKLQCFNSECLYEGRNRLQDAILITIRPIIIARAFAAFFCGVLAGWLVVCFMLVHEGTDIGDLRRLIRQYGRTEDNVFPKGVYFKGGVYGSDVNFPVPDGERVNPQFTGCIDRKA